MVLQDAWETAQRLLDATVRPAHQVDVVVSAVVDHPAAWAFAYQSRSFLEDADVAGSLVGNGPVVVPKDGRAAFLAGSGTPLEEQLARL